MSHELRTPLNAIIGFSELLENDAIKLSDVISQSLSLIRIVAQKANIRIDVKDMDNCYVLADFTKLKQILINLLSNAIKCNKKDGYVKLDSSTTDDNFLRVNIVDSGIGIPLSKQSSVFKPFNRLGKENSSITGTGIGLVVTKTL
ncbi:MAG: signal transduction histidine kinase [Polaribacter sp.]|jgi:signal transduction histidine kinase